jgi:hypothetical protein
MRTLASVLATFLLASPALAQRASWDDMAVRLLRQYLQIDTSNPPGHELKSAS